VTAATRADVAPEVNASHVTSIQNGRQ